jgi:hypothetical protein
MALFLGNLGNVGYGGLLKYENEVWLHSFSSSSSGVSNFLAKLSAIWRSPQDSFGPNI